MIPVVAGSSPVGHPTSSTPAELFASAQRAALERIDTNRAAFLRADDPEHLHQLRVGMRRLRSALRAFDAILPEKKARRLARLTKRAMRKLAAARDWDVFLAWLEAQRPPRALLARAQRKRAQARAKARRAAAKFEASPIEAASTGSNLAAILGRFEKKARKQARRMDWDEPAQLHELRIRVKRLRYASEFLGRERPDLKRLQEVLGELNDVEVSGALLRQLDVKTPALYRALAARERALRRRLEKMKTSAVGQASGRRG